MMISKSKGMSLSCIDLIIACHMAKLTGDDLRVYLTIDQICMFGLYG